MRHGLDNHFKKPHAVLSRPTIEPSPHTATQVDRRVRKAYLGTMLNTTRIEPRPTLRPLAQAGDTGRGLIPIVLTMLASVIGSRIKTMSSNISSTGHAVQGSTSTSSSGVSQTAYAW